jgi:hypothetical protein
MFTGIIECEGTVNEIVPEGSNVDLWIESDIAQELKVDTGQDQPGTVEGRRSGEHRTCDESG